MAYDLIVGRAFENETITMEPTSVFQGCYFDKCVFVLPKDRQCVLFANNHFEGCDFSQLDLTNAVAVCQRK